MKSSFADYPGRICSTIFIGGCNFRCPYCHNPKIVFNKTPSKANTVEKPKTNATLFKKVLSLVPCSPVDTPAR